MKIVEQISLAPTDDKNIATRRVEIRRTQVRPVPRPPFHDASVAELGRYQAVIMTDLWEITLRFYPEKATEHVRQFLNFARSGFYDGTNFHRIVPGFVVQGGAIQYRKPPLDEEYAAWLQPLQAEFNDIPHVRGTVAMARSDDPDSGLDSFFICLGRQPHLDGKYTAFGEVVDGMDVVETTAGQEIQDETPVQRIEIKSVRLKEVGR
ncbi:MAG: peptidylprolyl isomerase [Acidobacteria bacterium]|nr:peptidylprolyl isomerase [Acidobacteriota bacterium]